MAPALTEAPYEAQLFSYDKPNKLIFPDGIKTSGQTNPDYDQIKPFDEFPKKITGKTVWEAKDFADDPEKWVHRFTEQEVKELSHAADAFIASETPLTGICKEKFPLPTMESFLGAVRNEILNGKGFILFKGFPVELWGNHKSAVACKTRLSQCLRSAANFA